MLAEEPLRGIQFTVIARNTEEKSNILKTNSVNNHQKISLKTFSRKSKSGTNEILVY